MWVPVSRSPCRSRWDSSSRGSTSAIPRSPLTVTVIRCSGNPSAPARSACTVISGRPFRGPAGGLTEDPLHEDAHYVPLVGRAAPVVGARPGRVGAERGGLPDGLGAERLAGQRLGGVRGR